MMLIAITIAAVLFFISLSWKSIPVDCWEDLNGSKNAILNSLKKCVDKCWSKHDFGAEPVIDDCYVVNLWINDRTISETDLSNLEKNVRSYLGYNLLKETKYSVKIRYNYTGNEISFIGVPICGNRIIEEGEQCDGSIITCKETDYSFGSCTEKVCTDKCFCGQLNCDLQQCKDGIPTKANSNANTDWCRFCKLESEKDRCNDELDNDCDGLADNEDIDCSSIEPPINPNGYNILFVPLNYNENELQVFQEDVNSVVDYFLKISPFRECSDAESRINIFIIDPEDCQNSCNDPCVDCQSVARECIANSEYKDIYDLPVGLCKTRECYMSRSDIWYSGCTAPIPITDMVSFSYAGYQVANHEIGHMYGLRHISGCDSPSNPCTGPNAADCNRPLEERQRDIMSYCRYIEFGPAAYNHLKIILQDYLGGC